MSRLAGLQSSCSISVIRQLLPCVDLLYILLYINNNRAMEDNRSLCPFTVLMEYRQP